MVIWGERTWKYPYLSSVSFAKDSSSFIIIPPLGSQRGRPGPTSLSKANIESSLPNFRWSRFFDSSKKFKYLFRSFLEKNAVRYDEIGILKGKTINFNEKTIVPIDELTSYNSNWLSDYMS